MPALLFCSSYFGLGSATGLPACHSGSACGAAQLGGRAREHSALRPCDLRLALHRKCSTRLFALCDILLRIAARWCWQCKGFVSLDALCSLIHLGCSLTSLHYSSAVHGACLFHRSIAAPQPHHTRVTIPHCSRSPDETLPVRRWCRSGSAICYYVATPLEGHRVVCSSTDSDLTGFRLWYASSVMLLLVICKQTLGCPVAFSTVSASSHVWTLAHPNMHMQGLTYRCHTSCTRLLGPRRLNLRPLTSTTLWSQALTRCADPFSHACRGPHRPSWGPRSYSHRFAGRSCRHLSPAASHSGPGDHAWTANLNAANLAPSEVVSKLSMATMQNRAASDSHPGMSLKLLVYV